MYNDNEIKQIFADRLKELRETAGLTQSELAEKLGVSRGSISYYENQERVPDIVFLQRVSSFFRVGISFLMGYNINRNPTNEELGSIIGFSDEAIEKLIEFDCGDLVSRVIESQSFEKLVAMAKYFFMADFWRDRLPEIPYYGNSNYDYFAFEVSQIFVKLLSEIKQQTTEYMYGRFSSEYTKGDIEKIRFLADKRANADSVARAIEQEAEDMAEKGLELLNIEFDLWQETNSQENSTDNWLKIYRTVNEHLAKNDPNSYK